MEKTFPPTEKKGVMNGISKVISFTNSEPLHQTSAPFSLSLQRVGSLPPTSIHLSIIYVYIQTRLEDENNQFGTKEETSAVCKKSKVPLELI